MKLCFLEVFEDSDGWTSAAVLVTDAATRPLEFRVTDQVHTDDVQRALYGSAFDEHLYGTILTVPLLEALRSTVDVILVREQQLLVLNGTCEVPVLWVGADEESDGGVVVGFRGDDPALHQARTRLGEQVAGRDLLEPFGRIGEALVRVRQESLGSAETA